MKIVTLTLNPAYDVHCEAQSFEARQENIAAVTSRMAGGKGINISRALNSAGVSNTALAVLGQENAAEFRAELKETGVELLEIPVQGRIRENITLHVAGQPETRLSFTGFSAEDTLMEQVKSALLGLVGAGDMVTMTGRITDGVQIGTVKKLLLELGARGVRYVIDSRSFSLQDLLDCRPYLIKPNEEEIASYLGRPVDTLSEALENAKGLHEAGIENVLLSHGAQGALLVCPEGAFRAVPPKIVPVSTVGAGDSSIAGFLAAAAEGKPAEQCLRRAVAFGTAACLTEGTNPPTREDAERILALVQTERL